MGDCYYCELCFLSDRFNNIFAVVLQRYVNQKYQDISQEVQVQPKPKRHLTIQMDESWSFVGNTDNQLWV
ncbi:hypothetical protein [Pseudanabaena sp. SR411]|uniref:hypothetical protein n=1 Tax=Pseudanabaena sp. SR411 TaxID=1980935 RepID=UPI0011406305|nr:hypothetical protein [Pseudanabaena sp. SR411]